MGGAADDGGSVPGVRAFVAVTLPAIRRDAIAAIQRRLMGAPGVKWVEPENFHFTLRFLGQIRRAAVESLCGRLRAGLAGRPAFSLCLSGVGAFPSTQRPRTVWLGVSQGARHLEALAAVVEAAVVAEGFPPEERPFRAHLTLGRVKVSPPPADLARALAAEAAAQVGEMAVGEVVLVRSELHPSGPVYTPLAVFPLKERRA
ncbi:MAG: RNA 2',3'-cyclic phosphodiesterase [Armatimonadetes bacterium]|nr:RNA 2',3'-cyclic phosphodiesterase [Armatimonadota bacterium]